MSRNDRLLWVATALLCGVLAWWVVGLAAGHWVPQGDNAVIAAKVHDVFSAHPPLQGQRSTSSLTTPDVYAHHPGPIEFYLLALPYALSGFAPVGLLIGCALVQSAFIVVAIRAARATGGLVGGWIAVGVAALTMAAFGDLLVRPLNLYFPILGLLTVMMLAWRLILGHGDALIAFVICAGVVAQPHISLLGPVMAIVVTVAVVSVLRRRRRTGSWWPPPWSRRGVTALVCGIAVLAPVIIETVAFFPGNPRQLIGVATGSSRSAGIVEGVAYTGSGLWPWGGQGAHIVVVAVLLLAAAGCYFELGRRSSHLSMGRVIRAAVGICLVATISAIWTTSRIVSVLQLPYADAMRPITTSLVGFTGWGIAYLLWPQSHSRPAPLPTPQAQRRGLLGSLAAIAGISIAAFLVPTSTLATTFGEPTANLVLARQSLDTVRALLADDSADGQPVAVEYRGLYSWTSLGPAVVAGLLADGRSVYWDTFWPDPQDDDIHRLNRAPVDAARVLIRDGDGASPLSDFPGDGTCVWHNLTPPPNAAKGTQIQVCLLT